MSAATAAGVPDQKLSEVLAFLNGSAPRFDWVEQVQLTGRGLAVMMVLPYIIPIRLRKEVEIVMRRRGVEKRLVIQGGQRAPDAIADASLMKAIGRGMQWWEKLMAGVADSAEQIGKAEGFDNRYVGRVIRLAMLAPDIVAAIAAGTQPVDLTTQTLLHRIDLPVSWKEQRRVLGFG